MAQAFVSKAANMALREVQHSGEKEQAARVPRFPKFVTRGSTL